MKQDRARRTGAQKSRLSAIPGLESYLTQEGCSCKQEDEHCPLQFPPTREPLSGGVLHKRPIQQNAAGFPCKSPQTNKPLSGGILHKRPVQRNAAGFPCKSPQTNEPLNGAHPAKHNWFPLRASAQRGVKQPIRQKATFFLARLRNEEAAQRRVLHKRQLNYHMTRMNHSRVSAIIHFVPFHFMSFHFLSFFMSLHFHSLSCSFIRVLVRSSSRSFFHWLIHPSVHSFVHH